MKKFLAIALLALLGGCASAPSMPATPTFTADTFLVVALEYHGPTTLEGANTFGPVDKETLCYRAASAVVAQAQSMIPAGHMMVATCLHVSFKGPLPKGAVVSQPFQGSPLAYVLVAIMFDGRGHYVGSRPLHVARDVNVCKAQARDLIDSNIKEGNVPPSASLLIYCLPIPVAPYKTRLPDGSETI